MNRNNEYWILFARISFSMHFTRLICRLKEENPLVKIDILVAKTMTPIPEELKGCINNCYYYQQLAIPFVSRSKIINGYFTGKFLSVELNRIGKKQHYDIVNIHYPTFEFSYAIKTLRVISNSIVLSPWGSDVYRITPFERKCLKKLYQNADYITGLDNQKFSEDIVKLFDIDLSKITHLNIASETIDYISAHKDSLNSDLGKSFWRVEGKYIITCGYNGNAGQQHHIMLKELNRVKDRLPKNLVLFFPVTYGGSGNYIEALKKKSQDYGFTTIFFDHFLKDDEYFNLLLATDMFIHIQVSDSDSLCVKEYLYCGKKIINGSWLVYNDFLKFPPCPFYGVKELTELGDVIVDAYNVPAHYASKEWLHDFEKGGYNYWAPQWNKFFDSIKE